ncbi:hypothetical protein BSKO_06716 [Bryopsis sp. KO-2023]|nr:hypothetical protein BSKO_06716 [Bryopsis sp. KO-2023]
MARRYISAVVIVVGLCGLVSCQSEWVIGRATPFGARPWEWDIHQGSCGYNYLWPDIGSGWDVASIPDGHTSFSGSCGRCYEVACHPSTFADGFANKVDRRFSCRDPSWSLVVRTTDACPCNHPANGFENKRWCCGDMDHLALSVWAFEKLAPLESGSMGLNRNFSGFALGALRPAGADKKVTMKPNMGFSGGFSDGWEDKSNNVEPMVDVPGPSGGSAKCARILPGGAFSLGTSDGQFVGRVSLEAWIRTEDGIPGVAVDVQGEMGPCASIKLSELSASGGQEAGFSKYTIYLGVFDKALQEVQLVRAFAATFKGCGGNQPAQVNTIQFQNNESIPIDFCVDSVKLI